MNTKVKVGLLVAMLLLSGLGLYTVLQGQDLERVPQQTPPVIRLVDPESRISCYYHVPSSQFTCATWGPR